MNSRSTLLSLFAVLAAAAAVIFFAISIDRDVYAPGAQVIHRQLERHGLERHLGSQPRFRRDLNSRRLLRKSYSVVAFAILGFFAAPLIPRLRRPAVDALLVAGFSAMIEVAQKLTGAEESLLSNAFDIGCGALGGLLGAVFWNVVSRRVRLPE